MEALSYWVMAVVMILAAYDMYQQEWYGVASVACVLSAAHVFAACMTPKRK